MAFVKLQLAAIALLSVVAMNGCTTTPQKISKSRVVTEPVAQVKPTTQLGYKNLSIIDADAKPTKLDTVFGESKYIMIVLSQTTCAGCVKLENLITERSDLFENSKCKSISIVDDLEHWVASLDRTAAQRSYSYVRGSVTEIANLFGYKGKYLMTPAMFVLDRTGKIVFSSDPNETKVQLPDLIEKECAPAIAEIKKVEPHSAMPASSQHHSVEESSATPNSEDKGRHKIDFLTDHTMTFVGVGWRFNF
jgi:hypothetical protein